MITQIAKVQFIENKRFVGECTTTKAFPRKGPAHVDFEAVDVLPVIGQKTVDFIGHQDSSKPFFAYVALTSPHTSILPSAEWQGKSKLGAYCDFVMQTDAVIGEIVAAVDAAGLADNTLIVVTSDNGCSAKPAKASALEKAGHYPIAQFRGFKSDLWDGGHRVPFIVRWPAGVKAGTSSDQLICLTDLMATSADLAGATLPETAGEDSVSFAPALKDESIVSDRAGVIHHSIAGNVSYRQGKWKLLLTRGSGGWSKGETGEGKGQLYDVDKDPGETTNLFVSWPEVVERLLKQLELDVRRGRSTPGQDLSNDAKVDLWKNSKRKSNS